MNTAAMAPCRFRDKTGEAWWQYGAAKETPEDTYRKRMPGERFKELVTSLTDRNVV